MTVTPMMAQYLEIKDAHKDALLFYRMGDFYEMFFEDAVAAADALDIALTKRGKHAGEDIPMCGVPVHSAEGYFLTLIRKGFRVAVCEQMESPAEAKKRGHKAVVKREVVRIVTPGTLSEESLLSARANNFLASYAEVRDQAAIAWADMSTGEVTVAMIARVSLGQTLARLAPSEMLIPDSLFEELAYLETDFGLSLTDLPKTSFDSSAGKTRVEAVYDIASLDAFGSFSRAECSALGALISYLDLTQKGQMPHLLPPRQESNQSAMQIDPATRRNLELTQTLAGERAGSLLATIDLTKTACGARLLSQRLSAPSTRIDTIQMRQSSIAGLIDASGGLTRLESELSQIPDVERAVSRLSMGRGGPRDLGAIRAGLCAAEHLVKILNEIPDLPDELSQSRNDLVGLDDLLSALEEALVAELPVQLRDGGFVAPGYREALDTARHLRDEGRGVIARMQSEYQSLTGISSLKIKHNNVLGYFVETPATHADKMLSAPLSETFVHRQTTANQVRFTTLELSETEARIRNAGDEVSQLEREVFDALCALVLKSAVELHHVSAAIAVVDVSCGLARLAARENWARPEVDDSRDFHIESGRHPVVEAALRAGTGAPFVANDCDLSAGDDAAIWLLTGPNMAGKSTFLRQNALIAILAQMGSFVPASAARIGVVSQIFSRVGASDDLARGRSTFMVEMVETAAILNQSDDRALVILDEIGRGTSTYDGLSIAWATLEHLHNVNRCRGLFATHYHEMTALAQKLDGVENATVAVKDWDGDIIFLHEVRKGSADRSYGVQVAKLAGLPEPVINRARAVLDMLEQGAREGRKDSVAMIDELPLFSHPAPADPPPVSNASSAVEDALRLIHPDELTPRDALDLIYRLKSELSE